MRSELPTEEELLQILVTDADAAEGANEDDLNQQIAGDPRGRRELLKRHESMFGVQRTILWIWISLVWTIEPNLQGNLERQKILLFACCNMFYTFWNLIGRVLNDLFRLGYDFDKSAPSLSQLLKDCPTDHEMVRLTRRVFNSDVRKEVTRLRHLYVHQRAPRFGDKELLDIRQDAEGNIVTEYKDDPEHPINEARELLVKGFNELFSYIKDFQKFFDSENRALDDLTKSDGQVCSGPPAS
ncbi:MAG: hypothetical protein KAT58_01595 [candidate division Zixibacteria bacterium]|nr:hypothetical protein [candidate division Zixibacteria bacterium]